MENELYHHGILGMKWGIRRFQNEDGTLTDAGKSRYGDVRKEKKRVLKKKLSKTVPSEETNDITKHFFNELKSTEEGKAYEIMSKNVEAIRQSIEKQYGVKNPRIRFDPDTAQWIKTTLNNYNERSKNLWKEKYQDDYASRVLKDLGYDDTKEGRDYLKKLGI